VRGPVAYASLYDIDVAIIVIGLQALVRHLRAAEGVKTGSIELGMLQRLCAWAGCTADNPWLPVSYVTQLVRDSVKAVMQIRSSRSKTTDETTSTLLPTIASQCNVRPAVAHAALGSPSGFADSKNGSVLMPAADLRERPCAGIRWNRPGSAGTLASGGNTAASAKVSFCKVGTDTTLRGDSSDVAVVRAHVQIAWAAPWECEMGFAVVSFAGTAASAAGGGETADEWDCEGLCDCLLVATWEDSPDGGSMAGGGVTAGDVAARQLQDLSDDERKLVNPIQGAIRAAGLQVPPLVALVQSRGRMPG